MRLGIKLDYQERNLRMPKFRVCANETLYYLSKEIEAKNAEEAGYIYLKMIGEGEVEVNESDLHEIKSEQIGG